MCVVCGVECGGSVRLWRVCGGEHCEGVECGAECGGFVLVDIVRWWSVECA